jgi:3-deoxy-7-phosphoheptulonate synthase
MIESHLHAGAQKFTPGIDDPGQLAYGKSVTDACIGWDDTVAVLESLGVAVQARRRARSAPDHPDRSSACAGLVA